MRHLYTLAAFLLVVCAGAQTPLPFPDSAVSWTNTLYWVFPFPPPATFILGDVQRYCMNGEDTVINALTYTRVQHCGGAYKGALRDDAGAIRYVPADSTQEFLLYDFNLTAGQTAQVYFESAQGQPLLTDVVISNTYADTELGGRNVLRLETGAEWIEGIGPRWGLFTEPWINISDYDLRLECMSHGDTILFPSTSAGPGTCDLGDGLRSIAAADHITVSPNPTDGLVHCEGLTPGGLLQLTSADGRLLPVRPTWNGTTATLDLGAYAPGMYFLHVGSSIPQVVCTVLRR